MGNIQFSNDWIMMMVHDMKPPLAVLEQIISEGCLGDEEKELALIQLRMLSGRAENLLFCAKKGASSYEITREWFDIRELAGSVVDTLRRYPEVKSSEVTLSIKTSEEPCDAFVNVDVIRRVIDNLVTNAIRFARPEQGGRGNVKVSVKPGGVGTEILVVDDGPGIPEEFIERIFLKFKQLRPVANTCGLGLAFVTMAVDAHGGTVEVSSGEWGTKFEVSL